MTHTTKFLIVLSIVLSITLVAIPYIIGLCGWYIDYRKYRKELYKKWIYRPEKPKLMGNFFWELGNIMLVSVIGTWIIIYLSKLISDSI